MLKGTDYTGVTVSFCCNDGKGNYVFHKRGVACRDEQGAWDMGGGGFEFNEVLEDAVHREIFEEYGVKPIEVEFLGHDEVFREHEGKSTHWISFIYRALVDREKVINNEPDKHDEIMWCTLDKLPTPLHSQVAKKLERFKEFLV